MLHAVTKQLISHETIKLLLEFACFHNCFVSCNKTYQLTSFVNLAVAHNLYQFFLSTEAKRLK